MATLLVIALFALLEGGLRLTGLGRDTRTSVLEYQEVYPPAMLPAERPDGTEVWRTWDPRIPFQTVLRHEPQGKLRVMTFGGSTTAGLGYSPNLTFARRLEDLLRRGYPDRQVEVVNLGVVAISSRQVLELVRDAVNRYGPDLVVIYSGNNEFLAVHAEKFAAARATLKTRLGGLLRGTNLYRLLRRSIYGPPSPADLPDRDFTIAEEERLTQARIIREITVSDEERLATIQRYGENLDAMLAAAQERGVPILLCTVAVNWEWRGREDLPEGWVQELLGREGTLAEAAAELERRLAGDVPDGHERWDLTWKLAFARDGLGEHEEASRLYRRAFDLDPHQRRALDAQAEELARVAAARGALVLDTIALFERSARHRRVGFEHFFDYVHLNPRGSAELATGIYAAMQGMQGVPRGAEIDLAGYVSGHVAAVTAAERDFTDAREFLGIGFDPGLIAERDLWKYDKMLLALDERLARDPDDVLALIFRGNARSYRQDGAAGAAADYRRALELGGEDPVLRGNLERLTAERRVEQ